MERVAALKELVKAFREKAKKMQASEKGTHLQLWMRANEPRYDASKKSWMDQPGAVDREKVLKFLQELTKNSKYRGLKFSVYVEEEAAGKGAKGEKVSFVDVIADIWNTEESMDAQTRKAFDALKKDLEEEFWEKVE